MLRRLSSLTVIACGLLLIALSTTVKAENPRVTAPTDFWFYYEEPTTFFARTYEVNGSWSDPMLWLYDTSGILIASNDDWFGLQSRIEIQVQAGWYRLRAGVFHRGSPVRHGAEPRRHPPVHQGHRVRSRYNRAAPC